ncbi:mitotic spindle and nuclear protein [Amblyomma americanum]
MWPRVAALKTRISSQRKRISPRNAGHHMDSLPEGRKPDKEAPQGNHTPGTTRTRRPSKVKKPPNFARLHELEFKKMKSITDMPMRRKLPESTKTMPARKSALGSARVTASPGNEASGTRPPSGGTISEKPVPMNMEPSGEPPKKATPLRADVADHMCKRREQRRNELSTVRADGRSDVVNAKRGKFPHLK